MHLNVQLYDLHTLSHGVEHGVSGAPGISVIDRNEKTGIVHHIAVSIHHAVWGIAVVENGLFVAFFRQTEIALLYGCRPLVGLPLKGDSGFQGYIGMLLPQGYYGFAEVKVTPGCHAADEMAIARPIEGGQNICNLFLQGKAGGINFVVFPGQLLCPVAGETAGDRSFIHEGSIPQKETIALSFFCDILKLSSGRGESPHRR